MFINRRHDSETDKVWNEDYDNGRECQSLTHGLRPEIKEFQSPEQEMEHIIGKIRELESDGVDLRSICIVARKHNLLDNYIAGLQKEGIKYFEIKASKTDDRTYDGVRIATMHRVKGLGFDYMLVVLQKNHKVNTKASEIQGDCYEV